MPSSESITILIETIFFFYEIQTREVYYSKITLKCAGFLSPTVKHIH